MAGRFLGAALAILRFAGLVRADLEAFAGFVACRRFSLSYRQTWAKEGPEESEGSEAAKHSRSRNRRHRNRANGGGTRADVGPEESEEGRSAPPESEEP